jgi:hypothetical protein
VRTNQFPRPRADCLIGATVVAALVLFCAAEAICWPVIMKPGAVLCGFAGVFKKSVVRAFHRDVGARTTAAFL